jgi:hypothetical protein
MIFTLGCLSAFSQNINAQDVEEVKKDNSKPTNVYSQIDNYLEYTSYESYNTFGYNPRLTYTPNENHAISLEVPLLYSDLTNKFGLADMRLRYFLVAYRDYTKTFGSFGASLDVNLPTGNYADGLGSSSWRFSPGLTFGIILNQKQTFSIFPIISYIYTSKPRSNAIPDDLKETDHGINLQIITSFVISDDAFLLITPIYDMKDLEDTREDDFLLEIEPVFDIMKDRFQMGAYYKGAFSAQTHTFRLNFTVFL